MAWRSADSVLCVGGGGEQEQVNKINGWMDQARLFQASRVHDSMSPLLHSRILFHWWWCGGDDGGHRLIVVVDE